MTLTADRFEVPFEGGNVDVEVKSNIDYEVLIDEKSQSWIHLDNTPSSRALTSTHLKFQIDASQDYEKREGTITIKSGEKRETVTIYQAGEGILTLTAREFQLDNSEQDTKIEVSSNFEYSIDMPNVDWISEVKAQTRGLSTHTINLHVAENKSYDDRSATLRLFDANSELSEEVRIVQSQKNALVVETKEFEFDESGGTFTVNLRSNVNYKVQISDYWITEAPATRALVDGSHTFIVAPQYEGYDRQTEIVFSDASTGVSEVVTVKQHCSLLFDSSTLQLIIDNSHQLTLTNRTDQDVRWESSDPSVASVDASGRITALSRGTANITATTLDGKHTCQCTVSVKDITDFILARYTGGSTINNGGWILQGSQFNWDFVNKSSETVILKSLQLIDGHGGFGALHPFQDVVGPYQTVSYTSTIGYVGIYAPVTCRFTYEYKGKEYTVDVNENDKIDWTDWLS